MKVMALKQYRQKHRAKWLFIDGHGTRNSMRTYSVIVHTEQQRLEQLEHWRRHEGQARRSHWAHDVRDSWFFWHTQQHVGATDTPTGRHIQMCEQQKNIQT